MPPEKEESALCCLLHQWQQRRKKSPTLCYLLQKLKQELSQNYYKKPKPPILYRNGASSPSSFHREGDETPRYTREAPEL